MRTVLLVAACLLMLVASCSREQVSPQLMRPVGESVDPISYRATAFEQFDSTRGIDYIPCQSINSSVAGLQSWSAHNPDREPVLMVGVDDYTTVFGLRISSGAQAGIVIYWKKQKKQ